MKKNPLPPYWKPDAVATVEGWRDPLTGELLVAHYGLVDEVVGGEVVPNILEVESTPSNSPLVVEEVVKPSKRRKERKDV